MNIEKAKKLVKGLVFNDDGTMVRYIDFTNEDYDTWGGYTLKEYAEATETLLTAYEKEKDKNKKLQDKARELIFEKQELTSVLLDSTPNDKIKAKIEDILNSENSEGIEKLIEWQSLLEKE